ncbi:hypothetical protein DJ80_07375 [Halorubrum ezzemoulense]|uniref:Uncharacterized protein n=1 Tax=Halorubrum ezzemoulense TaxID=337243 RepID=A0A256JW37_HALEZ|nr:hypothetical protein DJ80_07375 [Halorubrum ezzemoulense]OYR72823.1 hypothetical protein DJ78_01870 [Halorubrum ezzemoulense]
MAVSVAVSVPCSDRSVRLYVPGESGSVWPVTDSMSTPDPVVTNAEEFGDAYVLTDTGVGPVSVVVISSVVVLFVVDVRYTVELSYVELI